MKFKLNNRVIITLFVIYVIAVLGQFYFSYNSLTGKHTSGTAQVSITIIDCPELEYIPDFTIKVGDKFEYVICADYRGNNSLNFTDNASFFNLTYYNKTCALMKFHAYGYLKGSYKINVSVVDNESYCNPDWQEFTITITTGPPKKKGGGGGQACVPEWGCTEWSKCSPEGIQTRNCYVMNDCYLTYNKPVEIKNCVYTPVKEIECEDRSDCDEDEVCIDGGCYRLSCNSPDDCPDDMTCKNNWCVEWECEDDEDCDEDEICEEHLCARKAITAAPISEICILPRGPCEIPMWLVMLILLAFTGFVFSFHRYYDELRKKEPRDETLKDFHIAAAVLYVLFLIFALLTFWFCPLWMIILTMIIFIIFSVLYIFASIGYRRHKDKWKFSKWYFGTLLFFSIFVSIGIYAYYNKAWVIMTTIPAVFIFISGSIVAFVLFAILHHKHKEP